MNSGKISRIENFIQDDNMYHNNESAFKNAVDYIKKNNMYDIDRKEGHIAVGVWDNFNEILKVFYVPKDDFPRLEDDILYIVRDDHIFSV